ncbi:heme NO-binding protein [Bacterioplanes sanyensis]|uniref:Heme NO-binding protein n=1 Tax=Bacterioplanes sanyensis TaxID=1249553 RepID=A0A222FL76_9GAMM|nr:heme NO-binding domain-containing protein [Bacterioplanes sanyensis]ASP39274.1 heme NO-binding protein [Bacterioplanes sanyensis]
MKGVVFDLLRQMAEESVGVLGWQQVLDRAGSDGLYVATGTYPDDELVALVVAVSEHTGLSVDELLYRFGQFMVPAFESSYPVFFHGFDHLLDFLETVEATVHKEVRKLYSDAALPTFEVTRSAANELTMLYRSPRKLCRLAEGLIDGSATRFSTPYRLSHDRCLHRGDDHCELIVRCEPGNG